MSNYIHSPHGRESQATPEHGTDTSDKLFPQGQLDALKADPSAEHQDVAQGATIHLDPRSGWRVDTNTDVIAVLDVPKDTDEAGHAIDGQILFGYDHQSRSYFFAGPGATASENHGAEAADADRWRPFVNGRFAPIGLPNRGKLEVTLGRKTLIHSYDGVEGPNLSTLLGSTLTEMGPDTSRRQVSVTLDTDGSCTMQNLGTNAVRVHSRRPGEMVDMPSGPEKPVARKRRVMGAAVRALGFGTK